MANNDSIGDMINSLIMDAEASRQELVDFMSGIQGTVAGAVMGRDADVASRQQRLQDMSARAANHPQVLRTLLSNAPFHDWNRIVGAVVAFADECINLERATTGTFMTNIDLARIPEGYQVLETNSRHRQALKGLEAGWDNVHECEDQRVGRSHPPHEIEVGCEARHGRRSYFVQRDVLQEAIGGRADGEAQ